MLLYSRLCNAQHLSVDKYSAFFATRILVKPSAASTSPITLYLTYLLSFDPVLHLFSVSLNVESTLPSFLCSSIASPSHTQYIVATPSLAVRKLTTGTIWTCAPARLAPCPWNG